MSENKLLKRLEDLYKLAILRPEEEDNEGRKNEARTAAFLLLDTARKNGVKLKFEVAPPSPPARHAQPQPQVDPFRNPFGGGHYASDFQDIFKNLEEEMRRARAEQEARRQSEPRRQPEPNPFTPPRRPPPRSQSHSGRPPLIRAAYAGVCRVCNRAYASGDLVWWKRGVGSAHEPCSWEELERAAGE